MKYFLIKAFKGNKDDLFRMYPADGFLLFGSFGLNDLENTLKGILSKGYRVRKGSTYSRRLKLDGSFQLLSIFGVPMVEVKEIDYKPRVEKTLVYYNKSRSKDFILKSTNIDLWDI